MNSGKYAPRLLGAAFLLVVFASLTSGLLLSSAVGSGSVYKHGYFGIHMWFYCIGGMLWYYMFYQSRYIPRVISLWGLVAVSLASLAVVLEFLGYEASMLLSLPVLPFELTIGFWLLLRGTKDDSEIASNPRTLPAGGNV